MLGETIKGYRITGRLGRGGMGEVWAAEHELIKTPAAIKFLLPEMSTDHQVVERFFNEAKAVNRIKHAGIVRIHDAGFHAGAAFLIMELLSGETLASRLRRLGRLPLGEVADIGRQIASVVAATHAEGITHRDLKPENVFLIEDAELASGERVKVLDFGIAKLGSAVKLTSSGMAMGTPGYMAPEQWTDSAKADGRADVYSLGCIAFEMCCGRPPFQVQRVEEAYAKHVHERPPRARTLAPNLPRILDDAIAAALTKSPVDRPSLKELQGVFAEVASAYPVVASNGSGGAAEAVEVRGRGARAANDSTLRGAASSISGGAGSSRRWWFAAGAVVMAGLGITIYAMHGPADGGVGGLCPDDMVHVPGGTFVMGSPDGTGYNDEHPQHQVTLSGYCIDRTEVTVAAYARCVTAGKCTPGDAADHCHGNNTDLQNHPINCVDWMQASAYCGWASRRLPTEAEWEYAARGRSEGRIYPWGNDEPNTSRLNFKGSGTMAVGSYPAGVSPFGALDMAGNVQEWVADWYGVYAAASVLNPTGPTDGAYRVLRGGSWNSGDLHVRGAFRSMHVPSTRDSAAGFRCARGN